MDVCVLWGKNSALSKKTEMIVSYLLIYFYHLVMLEVKPKLFENPVMQTVLYRPLPPLFKETVNLFIEWVRDTSQKQLIES